VNLTLKLHFDHLMNFWAILDFSLNTFQIMYMFHETTPPPPSSGIPVSTMYLLSILKVMF